MFDQFVANFRSLAVEPAAAPWLDPRLTAAAGYAEFAERFAGRCFENGLYRFHSAGSGPLGETLIADAFPAFSGRACPFGYDWLGRQFALDAQRSDGGEQLVLLMEPGTGEALEIPMSFAAFHEQLADLLEPALSARFFAEWAQANPDSVPIRSTQCVGYRVPLFLGGKDVIDNLEMIDLVVYWSLCGQLKEGTRTLPAGTSIRQVSTQG